MAKVNFLVYLLHLILLAGATLLLVFIILSGSIDSFPINRFYWIEADTSSISGAPDVSRWTFWGLASKVDGKSVRNNLSPAYPFSPIDNFNTTENIPQDFIDNRDTYYYLSRFAFAFFFIALGATGIVLILSIFSIVSYSIVKTNSFLITLALIFAAGGASFETAIVVLGRSAFKSKDLYVHIGPSLLGITWATVAVLIILFFLAWGQFITSSFKKHRARVASEKELESQQYPPIDEQTQVPAQEDPYAQQNQGTIGNESGIKFFKIRRHNKEDGNSE